MVLFVLVLVIWLVVVRVMVVAVGVFGRRVGGGLIDC